jgi:hypothetical protein
MDGHSLAYSPTLSPVHIHGGDAASTIGGLNKVSICSESIYLLLVEVRGWKGRGEGVVESGFNMWEGYRGTNRLNVEDRERDRSAFSMQGGMQQHLQSE